MQLPFRRSRQVVLVLSELLESRAGWIHGYALSQSTGLASGTLYPLLQRLAQAKWLDTKWAESETPGRPPRHLYRLNGVGARLAREFVESERALAGLHTLKPATSR